MQSCQWVVVLQHISVNSTCYKRCGLHYVQIGICLLNYFNDLAAAETIENSWFAFNMLGAILDKCGIEEAKNKTCAPSTIMTFIGVLFITDKMTIEVTRERLQEIRILLET